MDSKINYNKRVVLFILIISIFRIVISTSIELGNDESYYWVYSQYLQWNYFDHPPMVAIWTRLFTLGLLLQNNLAFLRLGSVIACGAGSWFMYQTVSSLQDKKSGFIAVLLYNASFYSGLTAGFLIMPDAPQMMFWTFSLLMIVLILKEPQNWKYWILFGLSCGFCIMSKVHGIYLWGGFGLYILLYNRSLLRNPALYIALIITSLVISPILFWNIQNDFVTYRFHSERIIIHGYVFNIANFFRELVLEVGVNNPVNIILFIIVLFFSEVRTLKKIDAFKVFDLIAFSLIGVVLFLSLFRDTRPIWSGPAYISLIPATAVGITYFKSKFYKKLPYISIILFVAICTSLPFLLNLYPGTWGNSKPEILGKGDISLDMYGWEKGGKEFKKIYENDIKNGKVEIGSPLICNNWWGAHEEYYFCRPLGIKMIGLGPMMELHQYMWTNFVRKPQVNLNSAYCIIHSDENYDVYKSYKEYYNKIDSVSTIHIYRRGLPAHNFYVIRLSGFKNHLPEVN